MSLIVIDNDPWIVEYELCEKLHKDILDLLNKRSVELKSSESYARLSSSVRMRLKQYDSEVLQLGKKLRESTLSCAITLDEAERRERLIEDLRTKSIQLQRRFNDRDIMSKTNRSELLGSEYAPFSQIKSENTENRGWSSNIDDKQLKSIQSQMLKEQDAGLEELAKTISRQKNIAIKIETEVDVHNEIIDDISDKMERATTGLISGTDQIHLVARKDATCCYWIVIITLLCAIIFVWI